MSLKFHTFIDNTALLENSNNEVISYITLGKNYIHYSILTQDKASCLLTKAIYSLESTIGQSEFDILLADGMLRNSQLVHIAIDLFKCILVPTTLLIKEDYQSYFTSIFEIEVDEEIVTQKVNEEMTELFAVKKSTLHYLRNEFKKVHFYSNSACLLNAYLNTEVMQDAPSNAFIHVAFTSFTLTLFIEKRLQYAQSFDMIAASDVLYCLLNVLQLHQVDMSIVDVHLTGFSNIQNQISELLGDFFKVNTLDAKGVETKISSLSDFPIHILYNQSALISCAS